MKYYNQDAKKILIIQQKIFFFFWLVDLLRENVVEGQALPNGTKLLEVL